jgi:hypothetical protein
MATYTYTEPAGGSFNSATSEIRFLINDTKPAAPDSLSDDELSYLLGQQADGSRRRAAAAAARRMAGRFARKSGVMSKSVNGLTLQYSYGQLATSYHELAHDLETGAETGGDAMTPIWTGDTDASNTPTDGVFGQGLFDNYRGGSGLWL